jgi:hypothetical protein
VAHNPCSPRPFGPTGPSRARAFPPLLSLSWRARSSARPLSQRVRPLLALSARGPPLSAPSSPRNRCLSCAHRGLRAHVAREARNRPALGHLSPRASLTLFPPSFAHLQNPFSTSPTLRARQSAAAVTRRCPEPISPSTSEPRRALCHGELRLDVRNPGHAPISPLPP